MNSNDTCRALVIEDDPAIRSLVDAILKREGFTIDQARTGKEAIGKIDREQFHLIILDLMMPEMNGYALLRYLREHRFDVLKTIIVLSADPRAMRGEFPEPICKFMAKPFDIHEFAAHVRTCMAECPD